MRKGAQLSIWITEEDLQRVRKLAEQAQLPLSAIVRAAIRFASKKKEFQELFSSELCGYIGRERAKSAKREEHIIRELDLRV